MKNKRTKTTSNSRIFDGFVRLQTFKSLARSFKFGAIKFSIFASSRSESIGIEFCLKYSKETSSSQKLFSQFFWIKKNH